MQPPLEIQDDNLKFFNFIQNCKIHGNDFIDYKCRFCCNIASYRCGGPTSYCTQCHDGRNPNRGKQCLGPEKCPLKINHAPTGQEQALGCSLCREAYINRKERLQQQLQIHQIK